MDPSERQQIIAQALRASDHRRGYRLSEGIIGPWIEDYHRVAGYHAWVESTVQMLLALGIADVDVDAIAVALTTASDANAVVYLALARREAERAAEVASTTHPIKVQGIIPLTNEAGDIIGQVTEVYRVDCNIAITADVDNDSVAARAIRRGLTQGLSFDV